MSPRLSIVIPCYNEGENLPALYESVAEHADRTGVAWELVLVDDGSDDGSDDVIRDLAKADERLRWVRLSRNFGQQVAICAGLDVARGELIMLMDADLQDPPEAIPEFVDEIEKGYDLVFGIREGRRDPILTRIFSRWFWFTIRQLSGFDIPRGLGSMRIFSRRFLEEFKRFPERQKFIEGIFMWIGLPRSSLVIPRGLRSAGKTKYGFWRKVRLATTAITAFSDKPLTLAIGAGTSLAAAALLFLAYISVRRVFFGVYAQGWVSMFGVVLLVGGIQTIFLGVLGKYLGRLFHEAKRRPLYIVEDESPRLGSAERLEVEPARELQSDFPPVRSSGLE